MAENDIDNRYTVEMVYEVNPHTGEVMRDVLGKRAIPRVRISIYDSQDPSRREPAFVISHVSRVRALAQKLEKMADLVDSNAVPHEEPARPNVGYKRD